MGITSQYRIGQSGMMVIQVGRGCQLLNKIFDIGWKTLDEQGSPVTLRKPFNAIRWRTAAIENRFKNLHIQQSP